MFLEERKRKWIVSYDVTIDGNKEEDLEHTLTADDICKAVTTALKEIFGMLVLRTIAASATERLLAGAKVL